MPSQKAIKTKPRRNKDHGRLTFLASRYSVPPKTTAGTTASHANKYIRFSGKMRMFILSPLMVIRRSKIIVTNKETAPNKISCTMEYEAENADRVKLAVMENDTKLHIGTVITARTGGILFIMARARFIFTRILKNLK